MSWEYNQFLAHFGIPGMKWGVRRYQNEDGTLTDEGRQRLADDYKEIKERSTKDSAAIQIYMKQHPNEFSPEDAKELKEASNRHSRNAQYAADMEAYLRQTKNVSVKDAAAYSGKLSKQMYKWFKTPVTDLDRPEDLGDSFNKLLKKYS